MRPSRVSAISASCTWPALLRRRVEVLAAILGPFDRPSEPHRRPWDDEFLGVEHHDLRPEPASDKRRDDTHLRFEQAKTRGHAVADRDGRLRRVPDRQLFGAGVPLRDDRAVLDRG
jgi:hypothetical protein